MRTRLRYIALFASASIASFPVYAKDEEHELDFQSSQAAFLAIKACEAEGCDIRSYRLLVKSDERGIEITLLGKHVTGAELFARNEANVSERHYLFDHSGSKLVRRWYGK